MDKAAFLACWRQQRHNATINAFTGLTTLPSIYAVAQRLTYTDVTTLVTTSALCSATVDDSGADSDAYVYCNAQPAVLNAIAMWFRLQAVAEAEIVHLSVGRQRR